MARIGRLGFLTLALAFHLMYLYSIFDIYFVSPIVSGMRPFSTEREIGTEAPAKRLVLFVGDGLRADKAFQAFPDPSPPTELGSEDVDTLIRLAPFVRSRVLDHGTFGVSHTRVPTESRPGHVALIAGLYEDVSAVMTGWKLNPVNFDSVFNRSRHTWSWGSPDILPMFKEGAVPGRVDADTYHEAAEDFTSDATQLDIWVFDKVKELFAEAKTNPELNAQLREDKIVFFLHLLGLDTTGHGFRPYSKEYLNNIKIVDKGVQEITELIDNFYNDGKTAYVFTADHGMSDWGSHGDGHPDNTRTPLVVWGSGVASPKYVEEGQSSGHEDGFSSDWGFDQIRRHDVEQADVAALMAYLVGLEFPVNSVGRLPLEYIDASPRGKALAFWANTQEVLEMYHVKEKQKSQNQLNFKPYAPLGEEKLAALTSEIESLISEGKYDESIEVSSKVFTSALAGLRYLQTYDWLFLRTIVTLGYLGWIAYAITTVIDLHVLHGSSDAHRTVFSTSVFVSILVGIYSIFIYQRSSWRYYAYGAFPVFFWEEVFARKKALVAGQQILLKHVSSVGGYVVFALQAVVFLGVLEALVQSYCHREIFTILFILAAFWPLFYGKAFISRHLALTAAWFVGCCLMSIFTLLPVVKVEDTTTITIGGMLMFLAGLFYLAFEETITKGTGHPISVAGSRIIMGIQLGMILLAVIVTRSSALSLQAKAGLPLGNQIVGWIVLVSSLLLPFAHRMYPNSYYLHRLVMIFLTFAPTFVILTISYEGLFYFVFCMTLATWVRLEHALYVYQKQSTPTPAIDSNNKPTTQTTTVTGETHSYRALTLSDTRVALFFFYLVQSGFFSTGNIASVSSFSLESVNRLIPIFNPFSQGALLILKLMIPFAVISANLGILNKRLEVAPSALFMTVMTISDISTLNFFYMVRDDGSWLEIGTTISHFVIANLLCFFVAGLEFVSEMFVSGVDLGVESSSVTNVVKWIAEDEDVDVRKGNGVSEKRD
ncbi:GPI-anchor biosynthetic protein (Mcd4), putative [Talaromyces stipitatus ATCC 10500]|uniref:GPI ethanolamine phosphate transferase 1 n=1 Tax=Talaromyces stipitatus (strain ATCC 10500 / CBS 375.48 / QM 6759 / NRRL 1006) TaxID=441959 RepID=B8MDQ2_TALSN|nr:GPI-anchor biosynthetic protein (Mcd4), putative [Talaromyces stipitatus ATCC 10500]EED18281.1 GPI-anchor biosynthetic protein (Mcd4), putative [Talaromyces stipitatus ATCC 10500]